MSECSDSEQCRAVEETCDLSGLSDQHGMTTKNTQREIQRQRQGHWEQFGDLVTELTIPDEMRNSNHDI